MPTRWSVDTLVVVASYKWRPHPLDRKSLFFFFLSPPRQQQERLIYFISFHSKPEEEEDEEEEVDKERKRKRYIPPPISALLSFFIQRRRKKAPVYRSLNLIGLSLSDLLLSSSQPPVVNSIDSIDKWLMHFSVVRCRGKDSNWVSLIISISSWIKLPISF